MLSDDEYYDEATDSGNDSPNMEEEDEDLDIMDIGLGDDSGPSNLDPRQDEEYPYEVLNTEEIVRLMVDSIKEVNSVIQVSHHSQTSCPSSFKLRYFLTSLLLLQIPATTTRILLNHFKWDKEKLMEKFYSDEQEQMFRDAKVVSPFNKKATGPLPPSTTSQQKKAKTSPSPTSECEICCLTLHKSVRIELTRVWSRYIFS